MATDAELIDQANVIKNETTPGANTADRIGDMLLAIINSKPNDSEITGLPLALKWTANVDMSSDDLTDLTGAAGSGPSGAQEAGNVFRNTAASTTLKASDGVSLIPKGWIIALQDTPTLITHYSFIYEL